jgi:hypothetical protein
MTASTEDYCALNDMPASMCAHCRGHLSVEEQVAAEHTDPALVPPAASGWVRALYSGACNGCGEPIHVGDWITHDPTSEYRAFWLGVCCAEAAR